MKILYYTNIPSPYRVAFFNELNQKNDVTVLFNGDIHEKYRNKKWFEKNKYNFKFLNLKKFAFFQLLHLFRNEKYDVVVIGTYANINGAILNIILRLKKISFFINADGGFIPQKESLVSKKTKNMFLSTANYYLSTSNDTNEYLKYYGVSSEKIFMYSFTSLNKSDILKKPIEYNEKIKMRKKYGYEYKTLFVSVGSFIYRKGYDIFLESIKGYNYDDVGFIIIGGGIEKKSYLKFLDDNNISNVHFIDFCDKKEIINYYKMADVFFCPSREDIWGLVINESMSQGLPVFSSNMVLASKKLLDSNKIYKFDSVEELHNKINEYISCTKSQLYYEGLDNLNRIKKYTIENMVEEHINIFDKVVRNNDKK